MSSHGWEGRHGEGRPGPSRSNIATRKALSLLVAMAVMAGACDATGGAAPDGPAEPGGSWGEEEVAMMLAEAGIAIYDEVDSARPSMEAVGLESPVVLVRDQVEWFAAEVRSGTGILGSDLDRLVPMPEGAPPFSYLPAAWLSEVDSPEADLARTMMGVDGNSHDWTHPESVVFPVTVLTLFVSNVARETAAESGEAATSGFTPAPQPMQMSFFDVSAGEVGVCSGLTGWVTGTITNLFNALKLDDSFLPDFLEFIWNGAVDLAATVVNTFVEALTLPLQVIEAGLKAAVITIGTVSLIASFFNKWEATLTHNPTDLHLTHAGASPSGGTFELIVTAPDQSSWSEALSDCASQAGVPLPNPTPEGKEVTWDYSLPIIAVSEAAVLDSDGKATLEFQLAVEEVTEPGEIGFEIRNVWAKVRRLNQSEVDALVGELLFSGQLGTALELLLGGVLSDVKAMLTEVAGEVTKVDIAQIGYHMEAEETPSPPTTQPEVTTSGCPYGSWTVGLYEANGQETIQHPTGVDLVVAPDGSGSIVFGPGLPIIVRVTTPGAPLVKVEQSAQISFALGEETTGSWPVTALSGTYEVIPYVDLGDGFFQSGSGDSGSATEAYTGAFITCSGDGNPTWHNIDDVSRYHFYPPS